MEKNVKFTRPGKFTGRNGYFKASGINIIDISDDMIMIAPLTSRNKIGRCDISIPKEDVETFIDALISFSSIDSAETKYISQLGVRCPFCDTTDISAGEIETYDNYKYQNVKCDTCNKEWTDMYKLTKVDLDL